MDILLFTAVIYVLLKCYTDKYRSLLNFITQNNNEFYSAIVPWKIILMTFCIWFLTVLLMVLCFLQFEWWKAILLLTALFTASKFISIVYPFPSKKSFLKETERNIYNRIHPEDLENPLVQKALQTINNDKQNN